MAELRFARGWTEPEIEARLAGIASLPRNYEEPPEAMTVENGWNHYFSEAIVGHEAPVTPEFSLDALPSEAGRLFREFGFVLAIAVGISSFVALSLVPAMAARLRREVGAFFAFAAFTVAGLAGFMLVAGFSPMEVARHAPFLGMAAQSSVGFTTMDVGELPAAGLAFLVIAMWIGGNSGSTAGGIKTFRAMTLLSVIRLTLQRTSLPPDAVTRLSVGGEMISREALESTFTVVFLSVGTIFLVWLPFLVAGYGMESLFDVAGAVTTGGLSVGIIGPELEPGLKAVLTAAMILGRVEFVALLVMIWPPTWVGGSPKDS